MPRFATVVSAALVAAVASDYVVVTNYANSDCTGAAFATSSAMFSGPCIVNGADSYSYGTCFNATTRITNVYTGSTTCSGTPVQNVYKISTGMCNGGQTIACTSGTYTPSSSGLTVSTYYNASCPASGALSQQVVYPVGVCVTGNGMPEGAASGMVSCTSGGAVVMSCACGGGARAGADTSCSPHPNPTQPHLHPLPPDTAAYCAGTVTNTTYTAGCATGPGATLIACSSSSSSGAGAAAFAGGVTLLAAALAALLA